MDNLAPRQYHLWYNLLYFTSSQWDIGKSFQLAIITAQINLIDYDPAPLYKATILYISNVITNVFQTSKIIWLTFLLLLHAKIVALSAGIQYVDYYIH